MFSMKDTAYGVGNGCVLSGRELSPDVREGVWWQRAWVAPLPQTP